MSASVATVTTTGTITNPHTVSHDWLCDCGAKVSGYVSIEAARQDMALHEGVCRQANRPTARPAGLDQDAELLAHARATVAAWRDGWPDPVAILAELLPVRQELAFLRAEDAELLAHARATVAAWRDGWPDPVAILAELLKKRGQMPRTDQYPTGLLALGYVDGGDQ